MIDFLISWAEDRVDGGRKVVSCQLKLDEIKNSSREATKTQVANEFFSPPNKGIPSYVNVLIPNYLYFSCENIWQHKSLSIDHLPLVDGGLGYLDPATGSSAPESPSLPDSDLV